MYRGATRDVVWINGHMAGSAVVVRGGDLLCVLRHPLHPYSLDFHASHVLFDESVYPLKTCS